MSLADIRETYGVPADLGVRIVVAGRPATIVGSDGPRLRVRQYGESFTRIVHPTWRVEYPEGGDEVNDNHDESPAPAAGDITEYNALRNTGSDEDLFSITCAAYVDLQHRDNVGGGHRRGFCRACAAAYRFAQQLAVSLVPAAGGSDTDDGPAPEVGNLGPEALADARHPVWDAVQDVVPIETVAAALAADDPGWAVSQLVGDSVRAALPVVAAELARLREKIVAKDEGLAAAADRMRDQDTELHRLHDSLSQAVARPADWRTHIRHRLVADCHEAANVVDFVEFSETRDRNDVAPNAFTALRDVLELHEAQNVNPHFGDIRQRCRECCAHGTRPEWPCRTVRLITAALTGED
ncbi:hypothetical protein [Amycolatopsis sp. CA-230715]|uniref:hypothetical protein n=1 Tax=Amycolatopsis sp. CA-230715 TaxID=2745196 RepID=UPI001C00EA51|nr:hypothetical protein [Amycolatopsis sp. CA-230715]QWF85740.1 hypothetical protein HUW46_09220 [Amycolatopsis sp. CA-230715]